MKLPVAQYPTIAPPAVTISATYPGADATTVQDTVTQIIEQNMNGIDNLMYMSSSSDSSGSVQITLTFDSGTDPDIAQVQVQNKLSLATPLLPQEVQQQGLKVEKSSSSFLMVAGFVSDDPNMTQDDIADYVASNIKDRSAVLPAWVKCSCSAPSTQCASGWTEQAEQLPADDDRRYQRHHRAEQPDRRRAVGRPATG
ncbi:Acriflavine resistance protein B [Serratia rubidaea]|uniref:Acriflavine resistance protein B n=1 Tax=Serratia rubidaea TaxID=61652 RepID=A0A447QQE4_SERRU|nr:Acriflavine resistance protein B [Serratia rubidaea]